MPRDARHASSVDARTRVEQVKGYCAMIAPPARPTAAEHDPEMPPATRILLVEDDSMIANEVVAALGSRGYEVEHVADGSTGLAHALSGRADLLITDRMLPGLDGLTLVSRLRAQKSMIPVLVLSALDTVDDRVSGLRSGSDDYLGKPFATEELVARVESLLRRRDTAAATFLRVDDLELDLIQQRATRAGRDIPLTTREFRLLEFLVRNAGHIVTRSMLLESVWDIRFDPQTNVVDVHISRLRQAVDRDFSHPLIQTVRGAGYRLCGSGASLAD
jgi:two-component system OmpR family response regulator